MCSKYMYINASVSPHFPDTNAVTYLSPQYHAASLLLILDKSFGLHPLSHLLDGGRRLIRCFSDCFLGLLAGFLGSFRVLVKKKKRTEHR